MAPARRVFLIVLDSLGVGELPDAAAFGDEGAHTLDHLVEAAGGLDAPRLIALGLGHVPGVHAVPRVERPRASFGRCAELSAGKDTSTGHWEMMGCVVPESFPVYPEGFPEEIVAEFLERTGLSGILCNEPASGTEVIRRLGVEHLATGKPIVYTSADSVFQIAAHEQAFGLERLYEVSRIAREILDPHGVARVIARPFVGEPGSFTRTYNRRDYSLDPPGETTLDRLQAFGVKVVGVGKIGDIFAGCGIDESIHTEGNHDGMRVVAECADRVEQGLVFCNLIDFDMLYGHRRDAPGYRRALEELDVDLEQLDSRLREGDVVILTADHGNDPTHEGGTDHTREYVPLLAYGPALIPGVDLGTRESFADVGATIEELFGLDPEGSSGPSRSFAGEIRGRP